MKRRKQIAKPPRPLLTPEQRSANIKAGIARAVAAGARPGNPAARPGADMSRLTARWEKMAGRRARGYAKVLAEIVGLGFLSLSGIAKEMNQRAVPAPRGGRWHPQTVARVLVRLGVY